MQWCISGVEYRAKVKLEGSIPLFSANGNDMNVASIKTEK